MDSDAKTTIHPSLLKVVDILQELGALVLSENKRSANRTKIDSANPMADTNQTHDKEEHNDY